MWASNGSRFNAKSVYDLDVYLTNVITRSHVMNPLFQALMADMFGSDIHHGGPVKTLTRCKEKTEVEYSNMKFPRSAHIIDVIRCSLTFETIEEYWQGIDIYLHAICGPQLWESQLGTLH